ncbi:MAG: copper-binding protein [Pseudomonadota bacterium]
MKRSISIAAAALALAGCGQAQKPATENNTQAGQPAQTYSGTGKISGVAGDQVTIQHGPIEGLGWPAMTMTFAVPANLASEAQVGNAVDFSFRQNGSAYQLTSLKKR